VSASARIAACVKWVDLRPEIDSLSGAVSESTRSSGFSAADQAAVETALRLGEAWGAEVTVLCVGPPQVDGALREALAAGAQRAIRVDSLDDAPSAHVAAALAAVLDGVDTVICGDYSADRGSGAVPAFLAAQLGAAQALGLVAVDPAESGRVLVTRRVGGGRSERLELAGPMVLSVEGSVAQLRRASLASVLASADAPIERSSAPTPTQLHPIAVLDRSAVRPRARALPAPAGATPRDRIVALTGALVDRTPPRTVVASPDEAADLILDQLRQWGYLD